MIDKMGGAVFLDPEVEAMVLAFFCLLTTLLISFMIWLLLICLRVDSVIDWHWRNVFIPVWIIDILILWASLLNHHDPEQDPLLGQPKSRSYLMFIQTVWMVVFQVLIVLHLDGQIESTVVVFIPYYGFELIQFGYSSWLSWLIRVVQMTCILVQLETMVYSWFVVFFPLYLLGVYYGYKIYAQYTVYAQHPESSEAQQGKLFVMIGMVIYSVFASLFYIVLALIIQRLDGTSHLKMGFVFIPLFVLLVSDAC
ncbi:hypothetical protein BDB01DRAFT_810956 [Pilobolus umbonatus]|nr:hypothetical protein BDB01DRAFT_810956 [Pilobolus umbonatus]